MSVFYLFKILQLVVMQRSTSKIFLCISRHSQQQDDLAAQHAKEVERLHDQIRRERGRNTDERTHYEREAEQVRRIANERANAEIARVKEEEENKRKVLKKKHQVLYMK